jgi:hypothetical protein
MPDHVRMTPYTVQRMAVCAPEARDLACVAVYDTRVGSHVFSVSCYVTAPINMFHTFVLIHDALVQSPPVFADFDTCCECILVVNNDAYTRHLSCSRLDCYFLGRIML